MAMVRMTRDERLVFIDWRNPQYQGPFSCVSPNGAWTWIPRIGLVPANSTTAQNFLRWL